MMRKERKQFFSPEIWSPRIERWKYAGEKLLFPHWFIKVVLVILSALALFYAFATPNPMPSVTYLGYTLSAYTLVIVMAGVPTVVKKVRGKLYANKYSNKYLTEPELRARISLYTGVGINVAKYRKMINPVLSAAKMLSLACAMVSILSLQTALLTEFNEAGQENFARIMNSLTGTTVCILIFVMAIWMIRRANKEIEKIEQISD